MPNFLPDAEGPARVILPAILDLNAIPALKEELMQAAAGGITVDAGQVQRISSLCLQLLLAAARQTELRVSPGSDAFHETARSLGLSRALGLTAMTGDSDG